MLLPSPAEHKARIKKIIAKCRASAIWFIENFVKIKHPGAGIIPFKLFAYQKNAIRCFRKHRMNIFRKCRQAGISKISGAFALWYAMFAPYKTILIVSRRDDDAMNFLRENVKLLFRTLPQWMQDMWWQPGMADNEHEFELASGSRIKSLTSHPDVLRSNASSLNIIDESAFIPDMSEMWAAGYPTLSHGGSVIVISTTNGIGNWYWSTWTDAEAKVNEFNPILINWWDMDWRIEYMDVLSGEKRIICPTAEIRNTITKLERDKYGPFWSPWLEAQYKALQEKGEAWKFAQEVLAEFIGSGNTVLEKSVLTYIQGTVSEKFSRVTGIQTYVNSVTNEASDLDFTTSDPVEGLWVWREPVQATPATVVGGRIVEEGKAAHTYVMGVDNASGKGKDYHALEVFDINTREQVAEMMIHCLPKNWVKFIDRVGRWYNCALAVVERNNGGDILINDLRDDCMYPRIWRRTETNDRPGSKGVAVTYGPYGFFTSQASKVTINKYLIDFVRDDGSGFTIRSSRLLKQFLIYVRKRDRAGHDTNKTEAESGSGNFDDLVIASGLSFMGAEDAIALDVRTLIPMNGAALLSTPNAEADVAAMQKKFVEKGGAGLMMPMSLGAEPDPDESAQSELARFAMQLGGIPMGLREIIPVDKPKHRLQWPRRQ